MTSIIEDFEDIKNRLDALERPPERWFILDNYFDASLNGVWVYEGGTLSLPKLVWRSKYESEELK